VRCESVTRPHPPFLRSPGEKTSSRDGRVDEGAHEGDLSAWVGRCFNGAHRAPAPPHDAYGRRRGVVAADCSRLLEHAGSYGQQASKQGEGAAKRYPGPLYSGGEGLTIDAGQQTRPYCGQERQ
jgi:hypothetical protein